MSALSENEEIFNTIRPNLMVGDPGVQTAIVASKHSIEWVGIMHGCYLPFPAALNIDGSYLKLLKRTWSVLNEEIDRLVNIGTNGVFDSWVVTKYGKSGGSEFENQRTLRSR